jgi:hypothetical protein
MNWKTLEGQSLVNTGRRRFAAGLCAGFLTALAGCGGDDPVAVPDWDVAPAGALRLAPGATFNLAATLPTDVPHGGVFDIDPSGAPLPSGITLQPSGLLTVGSSARGSAAGVVFRYTPPA